MIMIKVFSYLTLSVTFCAFLQFVEGYSVQYPIRSDSIVTKWPERQNVPEKRQDVPEDNQPGWMRRQLMNFGKLASKVGNAMGSHATKITAAIDKVCEIIKTIIPVIAAVCHVGQFKFCAAATEGPSQLSEAMNSANLNLDEPDRRK